MAARVFGRCEELLYGYRELRGAIVLLPVGSFEDHFEEPMVLDTLLAFEVSCRIARRCGWRVAWPLGYSFSPEHRYSVSLDEDLDASIVSWIAGSFLRLGASRVVVVDGHYGHRVALERVAGTRGFGYINVWDALIGMGYSSFNKQLHFEKIFARYLRNGDKQVEEILSHLSAMLASRLGCRTPQRG